MHSFGQVTCSNTADSGGSLNKILRTDFSTGLHIRTSYTCKSVNNSMHIPLPQLRPLPGSVHGLREEFEFHEDQ